MELSVSNHHQLAEFIEELLEAYEDGYFEEQEITEYLGGLWGLTRALDSWLRNTGVADGAPEQPNWSLIANLLHSAFYHS